MSLYEAFLIHMEPASLHELSQRIRAGGDHANFVIDTELVNFANEIDARLQKVGMGMIEVQKSPDQEHSSKSPDMDWLAI